jgi:23S rRNA (cytidine2498-2'-O)-methyltransferase
VPDRLPLPPETHRILEDTVKTSSPATWLIRIPEVFTESGPDIFRGLGAVPLKKLGREFHLIRMEDPEKLHHSEAAKFVRWNLPVHHSWPCCPQDTPGFIEKAAQALSRKFGGKNPQTIIAGALDPGDSNRYYRTLASNLRGRTLQLFPPHVGEIRDAEAQDSRMPTLFCLVGKEGLFCGMQSPQASNGYYPGGTKFISQNAPGAISRAGAKIAEALHHLQLNRPLPAAGSHWLELGASPGGMTSELLARGYRVTAVDRAPLDKRLENAPGLRAVLADAATFLPEKGVIYDAILSDMNGDAGESITRVIRFARYLRENGLVIFTLKMPGVVGYSAANDLETSIVNLAEASGLRVFDRRHLTYNRNEFTLFFERADL